jgi:hypothetical protein
LPSRTLTVNVNIADKPFIRAVVKVAAAAKELRRHETDGWEEGMAEHPDDPGWWDRWGVRQDAFRQELDDALTEMNGWLSDA